MKILVLEWDISRFSGRMATMVRFADAFKELGHEVHMCSNWKASEISSKKDFFKFHNVSNLVMEDFSWDLERRYDVFPEQWKRFDFIFTPYVSYGHLSDLPGGKPTVCWWISDQKGWSKNTLEFWTNSNTTWRKLNYKIEKDLYVVIPPYDYSEFRLKAKEKGDRFFDMAYMARAHPDKNLELFCKIALDLGLNSVVAILCKDKVQKQYVSDLTNKYKGVNVIVNADKNILSALLGNTKIYFHPSQDESCSIAIYEALNAGCFPICFSVGAVWEQLGGLGKVCEVGNAKEMIKHYLNGMSWDIAALMRRGFNFDRESVKHRLRRRLIDIRKKLDT